MNSKDFKAFKNSQIQELKANNPKIRIFQCEHVERNEFPVALNFYLGQNKRVFVCRVCMRVVQNTIESHEFLRKSDTPVMRILGRAEGSLYALKTALRIVGLSEKIKKLFSKKK